MLRKISGMPGTTKFSLTGNKLPTYTTALQI